MSYSCLNNPRRWIGPLLRFSKDPFILGCFLFIIVKIVYFYLGFHRDLYVQSYECLARMWHSYTFKSFQVFYADNPWLPLHPILLSLVLLPHISSWFVGSLFQTVISILGGIFCALLAREIYHRDWHAGVAALAAWLGSTTLIIIGLGYLSEPLFHLEIMATLYFGIRWMREGNRKWRVWTLISIFSMQLTRYEGWTLTAVYLLFWLVLLLDSRLRKLWRDYQGLWNWSVRDILLMVVFVSIIPLCWMGLNHALYGNPLYFIWLTEDSFHQNMQSSFPHLITLYLNYLQGAFASQPFVVILGLFIFFMPSLLYSPAFMILVTICVLILSNFQCIMKGATAFSYPERLSVTLFVPFCVLFGLTCAHLSALLGKAGKRLKGVSYLLFLLLILLPVIMGFNGFRGRVSVLQLKFNKAVLDTLKAELGKSPGEPKPRVLFEHTKGNYSTILFFVDMDSSEYVPFLRKKDPKGDSRNELIAQYPSIRYLILNHNQENVRWVKKLKNCHLLAIGTMWDLYEYRRPAP